MNRRGPLTEHSPDASSLSFLEAYPLPERHLDHEYLTEVERGLLRSCQPAFLGEL